MSTRFAIRNKTVPAVHDTAYPRLKSSFGKRELEKFYTPNQVESTLAQGCTSGKPARLAFLALLKTFQRLGYFVQIRDVPAQIVAHLAKYLRMQKIPDLSDYDESGGRQRHMTAIREFLQVQAFDEQARRALLDAVKEAALTKEDPADIVNVGIEELLRLRFELPGFTTLLKTAQYARVQVNRHIYMQLTSELGKKGRGLIDELFKVRQEQTFSDWEALKHDPGKPSIKNLRKLITQLEWVKTWYVDLKALKNIPDSKLRHFAGEAKSLDASRMQALEINKRYTLAMALIKFQMARRLDDLGDMIVKRIQHVHTQGKEALNEYRKKHQAETDALIGKLRDILVAIRDTEPRDERLDAVENAAGSDTDESIDRCDAHMAFANDNYASFLWHFHKSQRTVLFRVLDAIELASTSADKSTESLIAFIKKHRKSKAGMVDVKGLDLSWVSEKWWRVLVERSKDKEKVDRRHFEVCVFSHIMHELKSGDLCIRGSDRYSDYTEQLISWEEYGESVDSYCEQAGITSDGNEFVDILYKLLSETAADVDRGFPTNASLRIENGEPVLKKTERKKKPALLIKLEKLIEDRVEQISILDVFADTEQWFNWTRLLGPLSGHDSKIANPKPRYLITVFGYGCGLGASQTARSVKILDRRQIAWINQRHVTEELLDKIITEVINKYNQFTLPKSWGSGKTAAADGTKWDLYEQNLLSEYHIRYGGYGGLGYYHVSDTYIALFSHFIPCGVWEAVYILDGLLKNESDIQPDTLYADTQGQSTPVFGLAYLFGINLMPRIRNWKDLTLFRPSKDARYDHIDELFSETINWQIIAAHLSDMLRIAISIKQGRISASAVLRRLGTHSRKNKLYAAFVELGQVIRSIFLLKYISDPALRTTINAATNKCESFNGFIKWIRFADGTLQENDRDEQRKLIKYNHLVANLVILHNVITLTRLLNKLAEEGIEFDEETIAQISPYIREHINRFGAYLLNLERNQPLPGRSVTLKHKNLAKAG